MTTTQTLTPGTRVAFDRPGRTPITGTVVEHLASVSGGPGLVIWREDVEGVECTHAPAALRVIR